MCSGQLTRKSFLHFSMSCTLYVCRSDRKRQIAMHGSVLELSLLDSIKGNPTVSLEPK